MNLNLVIQDRRKAPSADPDVEQVLRLAERIGLTKLHRLTSTLFHEEVEKLTAIRAEFDHQMEEIGHQQHATQ